MLRIYITICTLLMLLVAACKKDQSAPALPGGSVAIQTLNNVDTLVWPLSILQDSAMVIELSAGLSEVSSANHWVILGVDTTKIFEYRTKYGAAALLPSSSYLL